MLDERARSELLSTFQSELREHTQHLNRAFLTLEKEPGAEERGQVLQQAFRAAHSLKGAARAVGIEWVERLSHELEESLSQARQDRLEFTPALFDLLYAALDALGADSSPDDQSDASQLDALLEMLRASRQTSSNTAVAPIRGTQPSPTPSAPATIGTATALPAGGARESPSPSRSGSARSRNAGVGGETLRLPAARLDGLLERLGELVVPRLEIGEALGELKTVRERAETWQRDWRKVGPLLRTLERESLPARWRPIVRFLERNETNLAYLASQLSELEGQIAGPTAQFRLLTDDLQTEVKRLRMLPLGSLAEMLERAIRDLARGLGKEARLVLVGADTELDRRVLEEIRDPLLHMLRNALDHGIEPPQERQRLGKPSIGSVVVAAAQQGGSITIEVEDDGAGIEPVAIRRAAVERGLLSEADVDAMGDADVIRLIFLPGFSSRSSVGDVSGRGVGLDVVARNVERLGGQSEVSSTPGRGTRFKLTLPLTLATTRAVLVEAGDDLYAIPTTAVERILQAERLGSLAGQPALEYEGTAVPVVPLAALLNARLDRRTEAHSAPLYLLTRAGSHRAALAIDRLVGEQEIVVKPLGFPLRRVRYVAGATILGSGRVVPILNPSDLVREAPRVASVAVAPRVAELTRQLRVLIADDSLTTRSLERYILEAAGYDVELAGDGAEAFALIQEREFDVLVSDVDMPELDGISLAARLRQDSAHRNLPIILVTSLDSPEDRARGLQAGADAYIVKSAFDQDHLLRTIQELVS